MANRMNSMKFLFSSHAQIVGPSHMAPPENRDKNKQKFIIKTQTFAKVVFTET